MRSDVEILDDFEVVVGLTSLIYLIGAIFVRIDGIFVTELVDLIIEIMIMVTNLDLFLLSL